VNLSLWYERSLARTQAQTNTVGSGHPTTALNDQEQLIEAGRMWTNGSTRREVKRESMRLTAPVSKLDT